MIMAKLCAQHAEEALAWLDYRLPPAPIQLVSIGRPASRAEEWRRTITTQQELIAASCARNCRKES